MLDLTINECPLSNILSFFWLSEGNTAMSASAGLYNFENFATTEHNEQSVSKWKPGCYRTLRPKFSTSVNLRMAILLCPSTLAISLIRRYPCGCQCQKTNVRRDITRSKRADMLYQRDLLQIPFLIDFVLHDGDVMVQSRSCERTSSFENENDKIGPFASKK